jgi:hypothetical protein
MTERVRDEQGNLVIPQSVRADGSIRKERRVREGYFAQDEVPVYRPGRGRIPVTRSPIPLTPQKSKSSTTTPTGKRGDSVGSSTTPTKLPSQVDDVDTLVEEFKKLDTTDAVNVTTVFERDEGIKLLETHTSQDVILVAVDREDSKKS